MSIMNSFDVGRQGLNVHGKRIEVTARNIANMDTPNYVRKIPVLHATEDISFAGLLNTMKEDVFGVGTIPFISGGVKFTGIVECPTPGERIYRPGHPDADESGFIRASNVNPMVDIADATMAQRAYEASLGVMNITKSMAQRALEIGK
ncbi:flagellar basal-body rod protein FlgC [Candidatus Gastranaerophilus sp. (ex Termes propinquus)]|nr:flagellar basal-body rod protein FlgC [Candidatus Gastranaerophilus sp. (ex Termes propinquus)]